MFLLFEYFFKKWGEVNHQLGCFSGCTGVTTLVLQGVTGQSETEESSRSCGWGGVQHVVQSLLGCVVLVLRINGLFHPYIR